MKIQRSNYTRREQNATAANTAKAMENIQCAIDCLCSIDKKDAKTKDTIANLGVVLLDMKSK